MDHDAKLHWARHHLDRFKAEVQSFVESKPYGTTLQHNKDTGMWDARMVVLAPLQDSLNLIIGDIVQNMRSALNTLTYALTLKHSPGWGNLDAVQFPIFSDEDAFDKGRAKNIGGIAPKAQTLIKMFQCFYGPNPKKYGPLIALQHLSNVDKHKRLVLTQAVGVPTRIETPGYRIAAIRMVAKGTPVIHGTVVASLLIPDAPPDAVVQMHGDFAVDIAFADEGPCFRLPVLGTLDVIQNFIRQVIFVELRPFLQ